MKQIKVYHAQGWLDYSNWIPNKVIVYNKKDADLILFEGGTDVDARLYGETRNKAAETPDVRRDKEEKELFDFAMVNNIPMLGVCRGSQFLCVMSGGKLVQHQRNPSYIHPIKTSDGCTIDITSTHHQAQFPYNLKEKLEYNVLAWTNGLCQFHLDGNNNELNPPKEVEIAYYPKTRSLCIQGHPENLDTNKYPETFNYLNSLVEKLMDNDKNW